MSTQRGVLMSQIHHPPFRISNHQAHASGSIFQMLNAGKAHCLAINYSSSLCGRKVNRRINAYPASTTFPRESRCLMTLLHSMMVNKFSRRIFCVMQCNKVCDNFCGRYSSWQQQVPIGWLPFTWKALVISFFEDGK